MSIYDERIHTLKVIAWNNRLMMQSVELHIRGYGFQRGIFEIKNIEWEEVDPGHYSSNPFIVSQDTAQELMNSLWECGLRPAQGAGSAGQLETMKAHLEDMRRIAFKFLKLE